MQNLPRLEVAQRALRERVCTQCSDRPEGSETQEPTESRLCEPECSVFTHLQRVQRIVATTTSTTLGPYEKKIREQICQSCELSSTAGDWCADRTSCACRLTRYTSLVIETLERL